ncbi:hypothetical protein P4283_29100 [Bacillus thuringiensis]|nr:hypothetical protein [Bacillus thuringiensis]
MKEITEFLLALVTKLQKIADNIVDLKMEAELKELIDKVVERIG